MPNFAVPPCDEAVIRAGSCDRQFVTNGPWILAATILGSSMAFIDSTVVNVALPAIQTTLHATLAQVQWVVESYALFLAALLLVGGSLGDLNGRRKIFAAGVTLFSVASMWCGLAPDILQLIVARGLQGVGGAMLVPGSLALISANFPQKERGRAIGTWSGFTSITAAIGPVLGGWFTQHGSWRWVFFINVPIGLAVLLLTFWKVPESTSGKGGAHFDWQGALLAALGFGGVVFALIESDACRRRGRCHRVDRDARLGGANAVAHGSSRIIPVEEFQRSEPPHAVPLLRLRRRSVLLSARSDSGARLLADASGRRVAALHPADVPALALVGRSSR